jgi:hypothetical protein
MSDNPIADQIQAEAGELPRRVPGAALAEVERFSVAELDRLLSPHTVNPREWIVYLMTNEEMPEADADEQTLGMLASILLAGSSEEALSALDLQRARELCGGEPGGRSPVLEFYGARALKSDYEEGATCYMIADAVRLDTGERCRFTTGARAVQMVMAKHCYEGWLPFKGALEIRRERTRRGFHPLNLVGGI